MKDLLKVTNWVILEKSTILDATIFISFFKSEDKGKTYSDKTTQYIDNNKASRFYHIRVQDIDKNGMLDIFSGEKKDNIRWEWNGSKFIKK